MCEKKKKVVLVGSQESLFNFFSLEEKMNFYEDMHTERKGRTINRKYNKTHFKAMHCLRIKLH